MKAPCRLLAHGCRLAALHQVGSYLGYTGRGANPFGKATRDSRRTSVSHSTTAPHEIPQNLPIWL
jgi:hypothetical protein